MSEDKYILSKLAELEKRIFDLELKISSLEALKEEPNFLDVKSIDDNSKDKTRFKFNGKDDLKKSSLVLEVINFYVNTHDGVSLKELQDAFPSQKFKIGKFEIVDLISNHTEEEMKQNPPRYFWKKPITLKDGEVIVVCNQWGKTNIPLFVNYVNSNYHYNIEAIKRN